AKKPSRYLIGLWIFAMGFLLVTFPTVYKIVIKKTPSVPTLIASETNKPIDPGPFKIDEKLLGTSVPTQPPLRIVVPTRKVDLSIVEASVVNGYWELSETTASHGIGSANPGQNGNIVVFAHARGELFGPLRDIQKNEIVYILTKDRWFRYAVDETKLVSPDQVEHIKPTDAEQLTLFTCSGFLDTKRLIVHAKPANP
ncbi:sortase, partial [Candidatus Roizmanbacteria bacterium]|nr:sortase [Candidatus Roizmanbacteria bacterium]